MGRERGALLRFEYGGIEYVDVVVELKARPEGRP